MKDMFILAPQLYPLIHMQIFLGAIGAFGQGMGDMDIAAAWHKGKVWFKIPPSVKINFEGNIPEDVSSKDIVLNLLKIFGANSLLGYSIEIVWTFC